MGANLENGLGSRDPIIPIAEAWIEEPRVVDSKFPHRRIVGDHGCGKAGRHPDALFRGQNVELIRIEDECAVLGAPDGVPEIQRLVKIGLAQIDQRGVPLGAVAHDLTVGRSMQIDRQPQSTFDLCADRAGAVEKNQLLAAIQCIQRGVRCWRVPPQESELTQPETRLHQDAERARHDLQIQLPLMPLGHAVKFRSEIRNEAREDVQPARGALRVCFPPDLRGQTQLLHQWHDVHTAALECGRMRKIELVHPVFVDLGLNRGALAGQKARAHPVRDFAEAQVETCRLDLCGVDALVREDPPGGDQALNLLRRQDPCRMSTRDRAQVLFQLGKERTGAWFHLDWPLSPHESSMIAA